MLNCILPVIIIAITVIGVCVTDKVQVKLALTFSRKVKVLARKQSSLLHVQ